MVVRAALLVALAGAVPAPAVTPVIREYVVSRPGNFPHDPAVGADGIVWYTDQTNSYIGRLDPATGIITDYPTPTPGSGPHGIVVAPDGGVWYTGQRTGIIGRLDPATKEITEYALPGETANPHTPIWAGGAIWYTDANNNTLRPARSRHRAGAALHLHNGQLGALWHRVGARRSHLDRAARHQQAGPGGYRERRDDGVHAAAGSTASAPAGGRRRHRLVHRLRAGLSSAPSIRATSKVREWPALFPGEGPYGIAIGPDGAIWYNHARGDAMTRFDPKTGEVHAPADPHQGRGRPPHGHGRAEAKDLAGAERNRTDRGDRTRQLVVRRRRARSAASLSVHSLRASSASSARGLVLAGRRPM